MKDKEKYILKWVEVKNSGVKKSRVKVDELETQRHPSSDSHCGGHCLCLLRLLRISSQRQCWPHCGWSLCVDVNELLPCLLMQRHLLTNQIREMTPPPLTVKVTPYCDATLPHSQSQFRSTWIHWVAGERINQSNQFESGDRSDTSPFSSFSHELNARTLWELSNCR